LKQAAKECKIAFRLDLSTDAAILFVDWPMASPAAYGQEQAGKGNKRLA
jgi:hypothetical protein